MQCESGARMQREGSKCARGEACTGREEAQTSRRVDAEGAALWCTRSLTLKEGRGKRHSSGPSACLRCSASSLSYSSFTKSTCSAVRGKPSITATRKKVVQWLYQVPTPWCAGSCQLLQVPLKAGWFSQHCSVCDLLESSKLAGGAGKGGA